MTDENRTICSAQCPDVAQSTNSLHSLPTAVSSPELLILTLSHAQQDMDLIEVLWKQDVDLGLPLVDPDQLSQSPSTSDKTTPDEIEKLKTLEAINATKLEVRSLHPSRI